MKASQPGTPAADGLRLSLRGDIDVLTVPDAFAAVVDAMPSPGDLVTLDMRDVTFIDSTGVSMLMKARGYLEGMGCRLVLANPSPPLVRVLTMVGLTDEFVFEDE
jgi:anti-sigma B factor antagonist